MNNEKLRSARLSKGWSQEEIAEMAHISVRAYQRWESGEVTPNFESRRLLRQVFDSSDEALGFEQKANLKRRNLLQGMGLLGGVLAVSPQELLNPDAVDRLVSTLKRPSNMDDTMLTHLATMTRTHWQLYAEFETMLQQRRDMLGGVVGHLHTLFQLMAHTQSARTYDQLSTLASETMQLVGEIFFDLKDSPTSERYYNSALTTARSGGDTLSQALALGRKGFVAIYDDQPQQARRYIQEAHALLQQRPSSIATAWLAAREAEACANMNDEVACFEALELAESHLGREQVDTTLFAFAPGAVNAHLNRSILRGFQGVCYLRIHHLEKARVLFEQDLREMDEERSIHNAIVRTDLAAVYVQQQEIEEACRYADEAIGIMVQLRSPQVFHRVLSLRESLEPWRNVYPVRLLSEKIAELKPHITRSKE